MSYGTPETSQSAEYTANFTSNVTAAQVQLIMGPGDGTWTQSALDGLFQQIIDLMDGASFLTLQSGEAHKHQGTNTIVTLTP